MAQVRLEYPNGVQVSVITDGYGSEQGLYEAMVWRQRADGRAGENLVDLIPGGDGLGVYGWLSPASLGDLLTAAAQY